MSQPRYVIITPAHNEEEFIERTIKSVASQSLLPLKWVIVNDASTDGTRGVIERHASRHHFIKLVNLERAGGRNFKRKVFAFNRGLQELQSENYEFIGNLDADITSESNYFERILSEFEARPRLGIAGGIVYTKVGESFVTDDKTLDSVAGAVQMFRRICFNQIGGYLPLENGGIDAAAEITARMKGWEVRKFPENQVREHRRTGTANAGILKAKVREGRRFYSLGYSVLFYFMRCLYRTSDRPIALGSAAALFGYLGSMIQRKAVVLPKEVVEFLRVEQRKKLHRAAATVFRYNAAERSEH